MPENGQKQIISALGLVGMLGISLLVNILVGGFGGHVIDGWLGTAPWGLLTGCFVGVAAGFWSVYKRVTGKK